MTASETRIAIQRLLSPHLKFDGKIGPLTEAVWTQLKAAPADSVWPPPDNIPVDPVPVPEGRELDERTEKVLATLNEKTRNLMRTFMLVLVRHMAKKGVVAKLISGTRTCEEQNALYAKGRTASGPKVTNAKCGQSNHNFGCAADVGLFVGGDYLEDSPLYLEIGPIAKPLGLQWGGDWNFKDYPHVEARQYKQLV